MQTVSLFVTLCLTSSFAAVILTMTTGELRQRRNAYMGRDQRHAINLLCCFTDAVGL